MSFFSRQSSSSSSAYPRSFPYSYNEPLDPQQPHQPQRPFGSSQRIDSQDELLQKYMNSDTLSYQPNYASTPELYAIDPRGGYLIYTGTFSVGQDTFEPREYNVKVYIAWNGSYISTDGGRLLSTPWSNNRQIRQVLSMPGNRVEFTFGRSLPDPPGSNRASGFIPTPM